MNLQGATVNFLGVSITEGAGASCRENRYTDVFAREFGLKKVNNYGISGTRIARQIAKVEGRSWDLDYCLRLEQMDESADAVVVFGGTNDFGHGDAPLGVREDRTPDTFWGACHYMMNSLLTRCVGKPVVIITPLHRLNEDDPHGDGSKPCSIAPLRVYRDILLETARYYALPVLDLYAESGIQPANATCRERLLPDGLHPNDEGHRLIALRLGRFMERL